MYYVCVCVCVCVSICTSLVDEQTYTSESESHWVPNLYGLVQHIFSDESNKLKTYMYIRNK